MSKINEPVAVYHYKPMEYGVEWIVDHNLPDGTKLYLLPDTHCIVPKEPTEKMIKIGSREISYPSCANVSGVTVSSYKAMIKSYLEV